MAFPHDYHRNVWRDFVDAVQGGGEARVNGEEALRVHHLIDAPARGIRLKTQLAIGRAGVQTQAAVYAAIEVRLLRSVKGDERVGHGLKGDSDQTCS
jgi:hypothetical protein